MSEGHREQEAKSVMTLGMNEFGRALERALKRASERAPERARNMARAAATPEGERVPFNFEFASDPPDKLVAEQLAIWAEEDMHLATLKEAVLAVWAEHPDWFAAIPGVRQRVRIRKEYLDAVIAALKAHEESGEALEWFDDGTGYWPHFPVADEAYTIVIDSE